MSDPVVGLVQQLIRNQCVNDGSIESGHEERSVATLTDFFGVEGWVYEPKPGRQSLVHRVRGWDPTAPTLALIPHLEGLHRSGRAISYTKPPFAYLFRRVS
ncbi:MAG: hypothetical protein KJN63_04605 [Acidimicrobiia bacterium]|nr:hypothetical protein [Acidimicrobiia bacterium]